MVRVSVMYRLRGAVVENRHNLECFTPRCSTCENRTLLGRRNLKIETDCIGFSKVSVRFDKCGASAGLVSVKVH